MPKKIIVDCEGGICGESRFIRVIGSGMSDIDMSELAAEIVAQMTDGLSGLRGVFGLPPTKLEHDAIEATSLSLDMILSGMGLLPRGLTPQLYHILDAAQFNHHLGESISGAVRNGYSYLRRRNTPEEMLTSFIYSLCHETAHLSSAIVVEMERTSDTAVRTARIRDGLTLIEDQNYFTGLNEAVTDRAAELIRAGTMELLGIGKALEQLPPVVSVYRPHALVVDGICCRLYPDDHGMTGWAQLLEDYWSGSTAWLDLCLATWPAAFYTLRTMDENVWTAEFSLRFLGLK